MNPLLLQLFISFFQIGLFSIGGGYATIPSMKEQVVYLQHWLSLQEFTDIITISQMTPGPLAVNTSTFVGLRLAGIPGAIIATLGCIISGFLLSMLLYRFLRKYMSLPIIKSILASLKGISTGLIAASAATILQIALLEENTPSKIAFNPIAALLLLFSFFLLKKKKVSPMPVLLISGILGGIIYSFV